MSVPTTRAALTQYITSNGNLDQITLGDLTLGLLDHFKRNPTLRRSVAAWLKLSPHDSTHALLVARAYAASLCGCPALAEVLLYGGFTPHPLGGEAAGVQLVIA